MGVAGGAVLASKPEAKNQQTLALMNLLSMAVHQFEEYADPGTFPGEINTAIHHSPNPRAHPFNTKSAAPANELFLGVYVPGVLFPKQRWTGLTTVLLGFVQCLGHGVVEPLLLHKKYAAGQASAILLQLPLGIKYIQTLRQDSEITHAEWTKAALGLAAFFASVLAVHKVYDGDLGPAYYFTDKQVSSVA
jgi:hypothetical protein